jgi:hypothetical protein
MRRTPGLWHIVLALSLIVTYIWPAEWPMKIWDERLVPPPRIRRHYNPRRNRERWATAGESGQTPPMAHPGLETASGS